MSKAVVILGAGASRDFVGSGCKQLHTDYLTECIYNESRWEKALEKYEKARQSAPGSGSTCNRLSLIAVRNALGIIKKLPLNCDCKQNMNYEHVIHILDRISDIIVLAEDSPFAIDIDGILPYYLDKHFFLDGSELLHDSDSDGWAYVPFLAREVVASSIIDSWESTEDREASINAFQDFLRLLNDSFEKTSIYSFNYDPLLFEASNKLDFESGFDPNIERPVYNPNRYLKEDKRAIAFVHGSIGFVPEATRMLFIQDPQTAQNRRFQFLISETPHKTESSVGGTSRINYNTCLITGLNKFGAFLKQPFSSYMFRFVRDIEESNVVIIVGFSLGDDHIDHLLSNAKYFGEKKYIVVDKMLVETVIKTLRKGGDRKELIPRIIDKLSSDLSIEEENRTERLNRNIEETESSLKDIGYAQVYDGVFLFTEGTKNFIERYREVLKSVQR